jgi:hypothetical protein
LALEDKTKKFKGIILLAPAIKDNDYVSYYGKKFAKILGKFLPKVQTVS